MAICGDGVTRIDLQQGEPGFEACDDGNEDDTDGCLTTCVEASCGDGFVGPGEGCDDGNDNPTDEGYDDGNRVNTDASISRHPCLDAVVD